MDELAANLHPMLIDLIATSIRRDAGTIARDTRLSDIEVDSLVIAGMLADLEHRLAFVFPPDHLVWFYEADTVGEFSDAVLRSTIGHSP